MNADRLARVYRWLEYAAFGPLLERCRFVNLPLLRGCRRILILGEGDGRALARLLAESDTEAPGSVEVVESSARMIALAQKRIGPDPRVRFVQEDARALEFREAHYDAVITFFFLDCFEEADARSLIGRLSGALRPNGLWLFADFANPGRGSGRWLARFSLPAMYGFFRITTGLKTGRLAPFEQLLEEAGTNRIRQRSWLSGMLVSEVWQKPARER